MREAAEDLTEKATTILSAELQSIDAVVGPATGATILARELSKILSDQRGRQIWSASPVKSARKEQPEILFDDYEEKRRLKNARVLLCEDVISTGGSTIRTQAAVSAAGGLMLPHVLALVNRSGAPSIGRFSIISLVTESMSLWLPEQCPLCKQGSRAIPAKDNWTELTRRYY
jgi:orotate phosphoribosyltransferase